MRPPKAATGPPESAVAVPTTRTGKLLARSSFARTRAAGRKVRVNFPSVATPFQRPTRRLLPSRSFLATRAGIVARAEILAGTDAVPGTRSPRRSVRSRARADRRSLMTGAAGSPPPAPADVPAGEVALPPLALPVGS